MKNHYALFLCFIVSLIISSCNYFDTETEPNQTDETLMLRENMEMPLTRDFTSKESVNSDFKSGTLHAIELKGNFELSSGPVPSGFIIRLKVSGSGNTSHLGKTDLVMDKVTTTTSSPWNASANAVLTAANGDELHFSYTDCIVDLSHTPHFKFKAECSIEGGTGRFKNATGTISYYEIFNWSQANGVLKITGKIRY